MITTSEWKSTVKREGERLRGEERGRNWGGGREIVKEYLVERKRRESRTKTIQNGSITSENSFTLLHSTENCNTE